MVRFGVASEAEVVAGNSWMVMVCSVQGLMRVKASNRERRTTSPGVQLREGESRRHARASALRQAQASTGRQRRAGSQRKRVSGSREMRGLTSGGQAAECVGAERLWRQEEAVNLHHDG